MGSKKIATGDMAFSPTGVIRKKSDKNMRLVISLNRHTTLGPPPPLYSLRDLTGWWSGEGCYRSIGPTHTPPHTDITPTEITLIAIITQWSRYRNRVSAITPETL